MSRSNRKRQQAVQQLRDSITPGTGVRTIAWMYARVKSVHDDTVELELSPGVYATFGKTAIAAVLDDDEYDRIVHGVEIDGSHVPDSPAGLTDGVDLGKRRTGEEHGEEADEATEGPKDTRPEDGTDSATDADARDDGDQPGGDGDRGK
ncbi:preprotein translocase subunit YajC [Allostreptomyces psammosilenae]|uniref:Preprotein translocase subunit YajC n=2 Tax=Allostreptomyces psammosilenae TaxID=1892865 RepID=A0A853A3D1_9ACTN|nr:preprotein translocase subunit YajC [Allostreptomyces psammosilenae]